MSSSQKDYFLKHNRTITNYSGLGAAKLEEFTNHIAGEFIPKVPQELVEMQNQIHERKSSVLHFFSVMEQSMDGFNLSSRLRETLVRAFQNSFLDETKITLDFLENLMEALDILKSSYRTDSADYLYLERLISSIFSFYKVLKGPAR